MADTGSIAGSSGEFDVTDTQLAAGYVLHIGSVSRGELAVGDTVTTKVDNTRRARIMPNHTMTHVLNYALREILGMSRVGLHVRGCWGCC